MTKNFLLFFLLLTLLSCGKKSSGDSSAEPFDEVIAFPETVELPVEALSFDFNVQLINMTTTDEEKLAQAMELVRRVFATEEFRSGILNHTYNGQKTFVDNGGYSNAQIYRKILDGAEKLYPLKNNAMDMQIELFTDNDSNTVGYTYPNTPRIWMNTKYFNSYTATGVTANLTHEWLHKIGFGHAVEYSFSRDASVPYAVGRLVSKIAATLD